MDGSKPYFVLCIDGGGFRGLASLFVLSHLVREVTGDEDTPPCQVFDLICGTSTGGLIAILLGRFGLSCDEAIKVYKEVGATMFGGEADQGKIWANIIQGGVFSSAMFEQKLEEIIEKYTGSKDTLFKAPKYVAETVVRESTKTFVTVVSKIGSAGVDAYRIRSYQTPLDAIDPTPYGHKWTIFEGARGTCATPLYFPPLKIERGHATFKYQDAGYSGFNNPVAVAIDEAEKLFGAHATITLVSLGTGLRSFVKEAQSPSGARYVIPFKDKDVDISARKILAGVTNDRKIPDAFQVARGFAKQLHEVANDTEISHLRMYEQFERQNQRSNYHRFNPLQGLGDIELTDYTQEVAISDITTAWLNSADGHDDISSAVANMKICYKPLATLVTDNANGQKRVLSIDGSGFRSYACLVMIHHLMRQLRPDTSDVAPRPCQVFDMICGTSTGGLIAILLGRLGLDCLTAMSVYIQLVEALLSAVDENTSMGSEGTSSEAFNQKVATTVERFTGDTATLMKRSKVRPDKVDHGSTDTFVTVVESTVGAAGVEPYRLRSYATRGGVESTHDHDWTICEVIRAATALPGHSKPVRVGAHSFQDASFSGSANPVWEAITEVELRSMGRPLIVSIGTGLTSLFPPSPEEELFDVGGGFDKHPAVAEFQRTGGLFKLWSDAFSKQIARVAKDTELAHRRAARYFLKMKLADHYLRFDPTGGLGDLNTRKPAKFVAYTNTWLNAPEGTRVTRAFMEQFDQT